MLEGEIQVDGGDFMGVDEQTQALVELNNEIIIDGAPKSLIFENEDGFTCIRTEQMQFQDSAKYMLAKNLTTSTGFSLTLLINVSICKHGEIIRREEPLEFRYSGNFTTKNLETIPANWALNVSDGSCQGLSDPFFDFPMSLPAFYFSE